MKTHMFLASMLLGGMSRIVCAADSTQTLFFEKVEPKAITTIALTIEGDRVTGTHVWQPHEDHGARGTIQGTIKGDLVTVMFDYTIEGSEQSEQQLYKLQSDRLLIGEGELEDRKGNGKSTLKNPAGVEFKKALKKVEVRVPKAGTPERKAIMDAMRGPVSEHAGKAVVFTGDVRASGAWACFHGNVAPADGRPVKNKDAAADLDLDFFALLKKGAEGVWEVKHSGFAGDIGVRDAARENFPEAPWVLFE